MKELSIEEKARRYDEAIERANSLLSGNQLGNAWIYKLLPELQESEDERIRKEIISALKFANIKGVYDKHLAWLEKQCKPTEEYNITGISSKHAEGKLGEMLKNRDNNVEPKFKVGDWIVYNRDDCSKEIIQVHDIRDGRYYFTDNVHFSWSVKECDEKCHLWKIQDAKPGDVLCCENGWTCIFKVLNSDISFSSYCFMDNTRWFCETGSESHTLDKAFIKAYYGKIYPATKEQREQLFKAIHEAGYMWDSESKKLLSLKAEPIDEQKPVGWSEEDEESILEICNYLDRLVHEDEDNQATRLTVQELKNWLKSLRPQNWTKEDKERYISCLQRLGTGNPEQPETINSKWFKEHVYPQSTWKPSDEQMNLLKELVEDNNQRHFYTILRSLYEQLKKLREELI